MLTKQKAIDRIIRAHKKLISKGFKHEFYVIGDGPERENLEKTNIRFKSRKNIPSFRKKRKSVPYIRQAKFF